MNDLSNTEGYFQQLNILQFASFAKINEIIDASDPSINHDDESIEHKRTKLTREANGIILQFRDLLKIIEINLAGKDNAPLSVKYQIYKQKLSNLRFKLRESQLQSYDLENELDHKQRIAKFVPEIKKAESEAEMKERLFSGRNMKKNKSKNQTTQDQILSHNKSITSSLQTTRQLMSTSIVQTELNIDSVDQQTKDLSNLNDKFTDFESLLKRSRNIVRFIEKQDRKDKNRIYLSISFLLLCCAWVIWNRLLKLPVKFMLWSFFKIFRIFNRIFVSKGANEDLSMYATVGVTVTSSLIASSITPSTSIDLDKEFTMNVESGGEHKTWEDVVNEATGRIMDEL